MTVWFNGFSPSHISDVFWLHVEDIVRQMASTELLHESYVVSRVLHGRKKVTAHRLPGKRTRAVESDEETEGGTVAQRWEVLKRWQFWETEMRFIWIWMFNLKKPLNKPRSLRRLFLLHLLHLDASLQCRARMWRPQQQQLLPMQIGGRCTTRYP